MTARVKVCLALLAGALLAVLVYGAVSAWRTWSGTEDVLLSTVLDRQDALIAITDRFPLDGVSPLTGRRRKGLTYQFRRGAVTMQGRTVWTWDGERWTWNISANTIKVRK